MKVPCPQCAGEVPLLDATGFVACPFCGSSLVLDLTGVRLHRVYRPRHGPADVLPLLRRFYDARGLPMPSPLSVPALIYYPFWRYATRGGPRLVPAWSTLEPRWRQVAAPMAEQSLYDPAALKNARVVEATLPEGAARCRALPPDEAGTGELVHLPFYEQRGVMRGRGLDLAVDACSGRVYADRLPSGGQAEVRREGFSLGLALLGFVVMYLGAAVVPPGWMAALVVGLLGWAVYWMTAEGSRM